MEDAPEAAVGIEQGGLRIAQQQPGRRHRALVVHPLAGAHLHHLDAAPDAHPAPHVDDGLDERLVVDHGARARVDGEVDAAAIAGLGQEGLGLAWIVRVGLEGPVVAEVGVRHAPAEGLAHPRVEILDDGRDVEGVMHGLAHPLVREGGLSRVHREDHVARGLHRDETRGAPVRDAFHAVGRDIGDDVGLALLEGHDAREVIGDGLPDHPLDGGRLALPAPPVAIGLHHEPLVLHPFHEAIGARADRAARQLLDAVVGGEARGQDLRAHLGHAHRDERVGLLGDDANDGRERERRWDPVPAGMCREK